MGAVCCAIVDLPKAWMDGVRGRAYPAPVQGFDYSTVTFSWNRVRMESRSL